MQNAELNKIIQKGMVIFMLKKTMCFIIAAVLTAALVIIPAEAADGELRGKTIILDAGHGLWNSNVYAGYDEQVAMLKLALKIKPILESHGATVLMTRPDEKNISVYARAAKVNIWALQAVKNVKQSEADEIDRLIAIMQSIIDDPEKNAAIYMNYPFDYDFERKIHPDLKKVFEYENHAAIRDNFLMISLHSNATGTPINASVSGANAFYMSNSHDWMKNYYTAYSYEKYSTNFAQKALDNIDNLGIKKRATEPACYVVIREHNVPAVLIENGFHTNDADRAKLLDDNFLDKLAEAYANAVIAYFSEIEPTESESESAESIPMQYLNAEDVKVSLNDHLIKWTQSPILSEGELYFCIEDIARISGYDSDATGILYRGETYELKTPLTSGGKLFISAGELLSIQKSVLWAEVKIDTAKLRVQFKINGQYEPKWDGPVPVFVNGELCVPLGPVLRLLGYTSERAETESKMLTIYRKGEAIYSTESDYVIIDDALYMSANRLNAIKTILWASFDYELLD